MLLFLNYRLFAVHVAFYHHNNLRNLDELRLLVRLTLKVLRYELWLDDDRDFSMELSRLIFLEEKLSCYRVIKSYSILPR